MCVCFSPSISFCLSLHSCVSECVLACLFELVWLYLCLCMCVRFSLCVVLSFLRACVSDCVSACVSDFCGFVCVCMFVFVYGIVSLRVFPPMCSVSPSVPVSISLCLLIALSFYGKVK